MITIYHNPRCSKSRAALELAQQFSDQHDIELNVIEYLKTPPNLSELEMLQQQLGEQSKDMVRDHERLTSQQQCQLLLAQPELLQRPIVIYQGRAVIGRPTELVGELLK